MSQASSSTAQNRPYKPKIPELNAEHKIIVTICCFWASIDTGPVAGNASFANSMRQYLGARFNLWLDPPSLLRYYGLIPTVLNRKAQVHDEEMIGHAIALLTQNEKQFDKILEFPINFELPKEAAKDMTEVAQSLEYDGRKQKVRDAWQKRADEIKSEFKKSKTSKIPSRFGSPELLPDFDELPKGAIENIAFHADLYLQSKEDLES